MLKSIKNLMLIVAVTTNLICVQFASAAKPELGPAEIERLKKAIVTIEARVRVAARGPMGSWYGTGFIIDRKDGLIMTNCHVAGGSSVGTFFVSFFNGRQVEAKVVYWDPWADLAIMRIVDSGNLLEDVGVVEFANDKPKLGDSVFVVSNSEGAGFSFHTGHLSDMYEINSTMPSGTYVVNLNVAGGSSGSPLVDSRGKAIGIVYGGRSTLTLALKQYYLEHALRAVRTGETPVRQHIGAILSLYPLDKGVRHANFPTSEVEKQVKAFPDGRARGIIVQSIINGTPSAGLLREGDIITEADGIPIGPDLALLDSILDKTKTEVPLTLFRNGKKLIQNVPVYDLNAHNINRMLQWGGAIFFEIDSIASRIAGSSLGSIGANNINDGSSFSVMPCLYDGGNAFYRFVVDELCGIKINNFDDLIRAAKLASKMKYFRIQYINHQFYLGTMGRYISAHEKLVTDITLDPTEEAPKILNFDRKSSTWISTPLLEVDEKQSKTE